MSGDSERRVSDVLDAIAKSDELGKQWTPIPNVTSGIEGGAFGEIELVQDFIVGVSGGLSAQAIVATIRAVVAGHRERQTAAAPVEASPPETPEITVAVPDAGIAEITIRLTRRH